MSSRLKLCVHLYIWHLIDFRRIERLSVVTSTSFYFQTALNARLSYKVGHVLKQLKKFGNIVVSQVLIFQSEPMEKEKSEGLI